MSKSLLQNSIRRQQTVLTSATVYAVMPSATQAYQFRTPTSKPTDWPRTAQCRTARM